MQYQRRDQQHEGDDRRGLSEPEIDISKRRADYLLRNCRWRAGILRNDYPKLGLLLGPGARRPRAKAQNAGGAKAHYAANLGRISRIKTQAKHHAKNA
ncbi:MAG: hypothetical protein HOA30_09080 [Rhodospirillaceae bacterium]|jgi:hypothetical protein|nr:hypothetical protein [Rhodospirillaceae bacterium]MBT5298922.1 hypothetical protein [Rhodospirillaceae bacterium]MBT6884189.1 hypothetical protein [Rhodospirillaceae bacterium]MBT7248592.1 hypothetical protein [Rhodospirillaceae bacterium]